MNEAKLIAEVTVLTEMVRVLSDKVAEMEALAQPEQEPWVKLTDEEAESAIDEIGGFAFGLDDGNVSNATVVLYAKAIEAKLKDKNS